MNEQYKELKDFLLKLKDNSYRVFITNEDSHSCYGHIITPNGNILYIQPDHFHGWQCSFQYVPGSGHGTGCSCGDTFYELTESAITDAEEGGRSFACHLKATLYSSPDQWEKNRSYVSTFEL